MNHPPSPMQLELSNKLATLKMKTITDPSDIMAELDFEVAHSYFNAFKKAESYTNTASKQGLTRDEMFSALADKALLIKKAKKTLADMQAEFDAQDDDGDTEDLGEVSNPRKEGAKKRLGADGAGSSENQAWLDEQSRESEMSPEDREKTRKRRKAVQDELSNNKLMASNNAQAAATMGRFMNKSLNQR